MQLQPNLTGMSAAECKQRLRELILEKALKFGNFTLASGAGSSYYIDGRQVTLDGEGAYCLARCVLERLEGQDIAAVGGMALGADPISAATAAVGATMGRKLDAFMVRKEPKDHGTAGQVEGPLKPGTAVAMVEDTVTTGGSTLRAIEAVERERQAQVALVIAMVDRQQGGAEAFAEAGYRFEALFTVEELGVKLEGH
jgi:orotate phosphoribosyltransferase